MPRGVYDRSKARKRKESGNGQQGADPFGAVIMDQDKIVYTPRPAPRNGRVDQQPWGQPYEVDAREVAPPPRWPVGRTLSGRNGAAGTDPGKQGHCVPV